MPFPETGRLGEAWGPQGGHNVKNSPLQMPLAVCMTTGEKQVEFQGKVWPGDINLGPISLKMLFKATEKDEITKGESVNTEEVPRLGSGIQHLSRGQGEEGPFFQNTETFSTPKGCLLFKRCPKTYRFSHIS